MGLKNDKQKKMARKTTINHKTTHETTFTCLNELFMRHTQLCGQLMHQ